MDNGYMTAGGRADFTLEEKKSVFIGDVCPVAREEEAISFIEEIRKKYPDARHHVYAYLLREGAKNRYSDDKEPQGTAGMPVLEAIRKGGYTDTVIVVTRYFGGILLGTGGLARAYSAAACGALAAAGKKVYREKTAFTLLLSYADYNRLLPELAKRGIALGETSFGTEVRLSLSVPQTEGDALCLLATEVTGGRAVITKGETCFSAD